MKWRTNPPLYIIPASGSPGGSELFVIAQQLNKPISYFFPAPYNEAFMQKLSDQLSQELLMVTRHMSHIEMKRLIAQARVLADFIED